jgi:translation initiation factor 5B
VTVVYIFAACLLCTILPSQVAFTSLMSATGVFATGTYFLIGLLRLLVTPDEFKWSKFKLGRFAKPFYAATAFFNALMLAVQISPFLFPVTAVTFNFVSRSKCSRLPCERTDLIDFSSVKLQAVVILAAVTALAVSSWWLVPADNWLPRERLMKVFNMTSEEFALST